MSQQRLENRLHLPDLSVTGFRGIASLTIGKLGRVTLLTGKNSVGKTSVLDAVRVFTARGHYTVLTELLERRDEFVTANDEEGERINVADSIALFHGRDVAMRRCISIGSKTGKNQLIIEEAPLTDEQASILERRLPSYVISEGGQVLNVVFQNNTQVIPRFLNTQRSTLPKRPYRYGRQTSLFGDDDVLPRIGCESLGPGLLSEREFAMFWDVVALTDEEERAVQALRMILGRDVDRVAMIGDDRRHGRRVAVKLRSQVRPVPLKSLGDGALRLLGVALALANSRDGFLLIDEAENGIHHSIQRDFWRMVLETADENNVQVLATTHSYDCVRGFAQAVDDCDGIEGALVRLEREDGGLRAVEYSERNIRALAKQPVGVEVR